MIIATAGLAAIAASAQDSSKPIKILVGYAAGGTADLVARSAAEALKDILGRPVIVENRPGAGGRIAAVALKNAPPDGDTLMVASEAVAVLAAFTFKKLEYDTRKDFAPVAQLATYPLVYSVPVALPVKTFPEYVAWLKANPSKANYAAISGGQTAFFATRVSRAIGIPMSYVPYGGGAPMFTDLLGGHVNGAVDSISQHVQAHRAGKLRILATTGATRAPLTPEVPTFKELGYDLETSVYMAAFAPAGTPQAVVSKLSAAMVQAMATKDVQTRLGAAGLEAAGLPSEQLRKIVDDGFKKWGPFIQSTGYVPE